MKTRLKGLGASIYRMDRIQVAVAGSSLDPDPSPLNLKS